MFNIFANTDSITFSLVDILKNIGLGGWVIIIVLLILSIISVYIFFERSMAIRKAARRKNSFINHIKDFIHDGKRDSAIDLCHSTDTPISRMIEKGLSRIGNSLDDISTSIENVGKLEIYKLENRLSTLASIAGAAPMLGFLGTVMGMVRAFFEVEQRSEMDIEVLASGIYTAMITTVFGLIVGILAYLAYNHLVARVQRVIHLMESDTLSFLDLLHDKRNQTIVQKGSNDSDQILGQGLRTMSQKMSQEADQVVNEDDSEETSSSEGLEKRSDAEDFNEDQSME